MKTKISILVGLLMAGTAWAFPPAPDHTIFGVVRDEQGRPLDSGEGTVIVSGATTQVAKTPTDPGRGVGLNYSVSIPMDAGTTSTLFKPSALRPTMPFTMKVQIRGVNYVPMQMTGKTWNIGNPARRTRLDLTLGVDSDNDGLPDAWEQNLIDSDPNGELNGLSTVNPNDDLDKDGLTNLNEYQLGTYALDALDGLKLEIKEVKDGKALLEFAAVAGRTYYVKSSTDGVTWSNQPVHVNDAETAQGSLRAAETGLVTLKVPTTTAKALYRLYGE
jgi:hypothetical protein